MLTQQLTVDTSTLVGRLVVTCPEGGAAELQGLAAELALRSNVTTSGPIEIVVESETPPPA